MKAKTKKNIKKAISLLILAVLASMAFIPLYWMVATAFTQPSLTMKFPPDVIPKNQRFRTSVISLREALSSDGPLTVS